MDAARGRFDNSKLKENLQVRNSVLAFAIAAVVGSSLPASNAYAWQQCALSERTYEFNNGHWVPAGIVASALFETCEICAADAAKNNQALGKLHFVPPGPNPKTANSELYNYSCAPVIL